MIKNTRNYGNKWTDGLFRNFTFCEMREREREREREILVINAKNEIAREKAKIFFKEMY
jgi:hypothetical protein